MKKLFAILSVLLLAYTANAQTYPLHFNAEGKYKIVQFTDLHYQKENPESKVVIELLDEVLDAEKPDLVVFTGDVVWAKPATKALDDVFAPVIQRKIPFAYIFGNHDDEYDLSRQQLMDYSMQQPYFVGQAGNKSLTGVGNYILEVKNRKIEKNSLLLYFFDSSAYSSIKEIKGYGWMALDQVQWYANESKAYTQENGGKPYPALAFFHIPLPEYPLMTMDKTTFIGEKREDECNPKINTGMFAAMRQAGDVMATFVGHDHDNDYIGNYYDIYLAYGRYSGGKTVYNNLGKNGCRIIELEEEKRGFSTYIRLLGGEKLYPVEYPTTIERKEKK